MLYRGPFGTAFYRKLHTVAHKEFRLRKTAAELANVLRGRGRVSAGLAGRVARLAYQAVTLPLARWQLDRLGRAGPGPALGLQGGPAPLDPEAAARPSVPAEVER